MKTLLKPQLLLALAMTLATSAALADDLACKFYPKQAGLIEGYTAPTPDEKASGLELIAGLAEKEIFAADPFAKKLDGIALVREGKDTWVVRKASAGKAGPPYASVQGLPSVNEQSRPDYHRALNAVLIDSLNRGISLSIKGSCN